LAQRLLREFGTKLIHLILGNDSTERGETTAQAVLAVPVLLLFLLIGIQSALYFHTAQLATIAAQEGAVAGAIVNGSEVQAIAAAVVSVAEQHAVLAHEPRADIRNGVIEVQVVLDVPVVVPMFPSKVVRAASEPLERYVYEADR
jgi:hypothetical protein